MSGTSESEGTERMQRVEVGIPGFDALALGGLPKGRTTLLAGGTGSGTTVFGLQFLASGAMELGERGVLVTFAERPEDLIANTESFGWGLRGLVDDGRLVIVDATPDRGAIVSGRFDLGGLSSRIAHALEQVEGKRLVLDPIDALFEGFSDAVGVRRAFAAMVGELRSLGASTLLVAERPGDVGYVAGYGAEEFVVDNVVILRNDRDAEQRRRTVEVLKLRGAEHRKGEFPFVINPKRGIEIVPFSIIEAPRDAAIERMSLGTAELDEMCEGGIWRDSLVMVTGATGTGKTLMGVQFLAAGLAAAERGLLLSFEENPSQLVRNARSWGIELEAPQRDGRLRIMSRYPERTGLEDLLVEIKHQVDEFAPQRFLIYSMTALEHNSPPRAFREFGVGLTGFLKGRGVGAMMTTTLPSLLGGEHATAVYLSTITDSIIALRYFEIDSQVRRAVLVLKLRGSAHARAMHEYEVTDHGMRLLGPIRGVRGILAGLAQITDETHPLDEAPLGTPG
ncbi:MAG: circadian clock protein KaiC [Solirubrobacteraceae bacterium]